VIYQGRNRIAHHEPVIGQRLESLVESLEFIAQHFGAKVPGEDAVLAKMTFHHREQLAREAKELNAFIAKFTVPQSPP
jgi:hypothetical protein